MSEHKIHSGDVEVVLGDHKLTLKPNLDAAIRLSGLPGGITKMVDRCLNYEFDAILSVITTGIGKSSKDLPQLVFETGMVELSPICIKYLSIIANGGRPMDEEEEGEGEPDPLVQSS